MKRYLLLSAALLVAGPALAQTTVVTPTQPASPPLVVQGGSPATANSGPAATGTVAPTGTGAESITNNSAGTGNAEQPARAVPQTGKGGGAASPGG